MSLSMGARWFAGRPRSLPSPWQTRLRKGLPIWWTSISPPTIARIASNVFGILVTCGGWPTRKIMTRTVLRMLVIQISCFFSGRDLTDLTPDLIQDLNPDLTKDTWCLCISLFFISWISGPGVPRFGSRPHSRPGSGPDSRPDPRYDAGPDPRPDTNTGPLAVCWF